MTQNRQSTKIYVVPHNTLSESFRKRIVWFQPKQDSDRKRISFFKNRIGSDSKKSLSDHLCWLGKIHFQRPLIAYDVTLFNQPCQDLLTRRVAVVYRIRSLESNPAGYLDFFGFALVWISFPLQPDPDYPNETKFDHAKNLDMEL